MNFYVRITLPDNHSAASQDFITEELKLKGVRFEGEDDNGCSLFVTNDPIDPVFMLDAIERQIEIIDLMDTMAHLNKDGEILGDDTFVMEPDDAVDTVHSLISRARDITGISDRPTEDNV